MVSPASDLLQVATSGCYKREEGLGVRLEGSMVLPASDLSASDLGALDLGGRLDPQPSWSIRTYHNKHTP